MGKHRSKIIYLKGGRERGFKWFLKIDISTNQREWASNFYLSDKIERIKEIHLAWSSEENYKWRLSINISAKQPKLRGTFYLADEKEKNKTKRRREDRTWAKKTFPCSWKQQYEIHHDWDSPMETCYFLTKEQHHNLHHDTS